MDQTCDKTFLHQALKLWFYFYIHSKSRIGGP